MVTVAMSHAAIFIAFVTITVVTTTAVARHLTS